MIKDLYRIDITVVKNRKVISQICTYFNNLDECKTVADKIANDVAEAYKKKCGVEKVNIDEEEYNGAFCFLTKRVSPFNDFSNHVKIRLVSKMKHSSYEQNITSIISDINNG